MNTTDAAQPGSTAVDDAARAFQLLLALDPHHAERQELAASGVSSARIEALYGREFAALLPRLCDHISAVADTELLPAGSLKIRGGRIWPVAWDKMPPEHYGASSDAYFADQKSIDGLAYHLSDRIDALGEDSPLYQSDVMPQQIATFIWSAWWLMSNRGLLTSDHQQQVDELMLGVARGLALRG